MELVERRRGEQTVLARFEGRDRYDVEVFEGAYALRMEREGKESMLAVPAFAELVAGEVLAIELPGFRPEDEVDFAWIPPGPALIGDRWGIGQEDERPARLVDVDGFWIGRHEITNAEYAVFLRENHSGPLKDWIDLGSRKCRVQPAPGFETEVPDLPVVTVTAAGAEAYCDWLSRKTGRRHRLPREFEWEKAARGPFSLSYGYGDAYVRESANQESGSLKPVGSYPAGDWGLFDMTGNAFEWVDDRYHAGRPPLAPGESEPVPPPSEVDGPDWVLRGGSYVLDGIYLRNSFRMRQRPTVKSDDFGFRVLREAGIEGKRP